MSCCMHVPYVLECVPCAPQVAAANGNRPAWSVFQFLRLVHHAGSQVTETSQQDVFPQTPDKLTQTTPWLTRQNT